MNKKTSMLFLNAALFISRVVLYALLAGIVFYVGMYHGSGHMEPVQGERTVYVVCEYVHSTNGHAGTEGTRNCHSVDKVRIVHSVGAPIYRLRNQ